MRPAERDGNWDPLSYLELCRSEEPGHYSTVRMRTGDSKKDWVCSVTTIVIRTRVCVILFV